MGLAQQGTTSSTGNTTPAYYRAGGVTESEKEREWRAEPLVGANVANREIVSIRRRKFPAEKTLRSRLITPVYLMYVRSYISC